MLQYSIYKYQLQIVEPHPIASVNCLTTDFSQEERDHVGQEMSDILIYLVRLADRCRIDLPSAVLQKIEHNAQKYPVNKAYGNNKKYTAYAAEDAGKALPDGDQ